MALPGPDLPGDRIGSVVPVDRGPNSFPGKNVPAEIVDRYQASASKWVQSFRCAHLKVLIVCRGPVRKEAMDVFRSLGAGYGILLSEKDSVTYPQTLAPELRVIEDQSCIHRVPDYSGSTGEERKQRIAQIVEIARTGGYTHIFAGYGFMAEDAEFVEAIEKGGIGFMGPASRVQRQAGSKDESKKLARRLNVSVTPGVDNITALTLLDKAGGTFEGLKTIAEKNGLSVAGLDQNDLEGLAEQILQQSYTRTVGLFTLQELQARTRKEVETILRENPGKRLRFKYIGGGGGKGQRIISAVEESDTAVVEVLSESKAMGDADNRNFLIELNIEKTRHNEIQLLGNGTWSIALGGRDCSLQMHEQKLVEISITDELFEVEIRRAQSEGRSSFATELQKDRDMLRRMEEQSERFGQEVALNSASTFECIVTDHDFYFMEMNTRIQVEHRVTEMVYSLRFENPADPGDFFIVESLVEAMALIAAHGQRLPRPVRLARHVAGGEVRLNATNDALQPHAGGKIESWSAPVDHEIRDDQGIGVRNPDTKAFIHYYLAGAYDSNIALIVSYHTGRRELLERLADLLRRTELRGVDLHTNLSFHYGILNFTLGLHPMLKPDTKFALAYLAGVGALAAEQNQIDLEFVWKNISAKVREKFGAQADQVLQMKMTLLPRVLGALLDNPHTLMGWLVLNNNRAFTLDGGRVLWRRNPLFVLNDLYRIMHLEDRLKASPAQKIWDHDHKLLEKGLGFYGDLDRTLGTNSEEAYLLALARSGTNNSSEWQHLDAALFAGDRSSPFAGKLGDLFEDICAAHRGWQIGLSMIELLVRLGQRAGVFGFGVDDLLAPIVPEQFRHADAQKELIVHLAPPPAPSGNELLAVTGGMFYGRETPASEPYLKVGQHFNAGQPAYIIEVMKMFNKVYTEFAGTVEEVLVKEDRGVVVRKGQPLFRVKPDVAIKIESPEEKFARIKQKTTSLLNEIAV